MIDLFYMGGPLFMGILTILFVLLIVAILMQLKSKSEFYSLSLIKDIGILSLVVGIFGQLIGLYGAFSAIEQFGEVSPAILAGGLKVSMIPTLYGFVIFILAFAYGTLQAKFKTEN